MMMIWYFTSLSTLLKSYQDGGRVSQIDNQRLCAMKCYSHEQNSDSAEYDPRTLWSEVRFNGSKSKTICPTPPMPILLIGKG